VTAPREVLVVTGAGGMGEAVARRLGGGRAVVLADVTGEQVERVAAALAGEGHDTHAVVVDVSSAQDVRRLADTAAGLGPVRCIVHTAGVSPTQASAERIVDVDVIGTARILDAFESLVEPGTVCVCIASMAGTMAQLDSATCKLLATTPTDELRELPVLDPAGLDPGHAYSVAKRANQVRVQAASLSWGRRGGRVVSISPGVIATPMGAAELAGPSGGFMRDLVAMSGTGRLGSADDIAAAVEFLAGPAASFITGTDLLVDGGVIAALQTA
jgi:NAD(P)-dependent dehydrogenase (short-subunit alcohol dehydrogenase family)